MRWFLPSWNGDVRAESVDDKTTKLTIVDPTAHEQEVLKLLETIFRDRKWYGDKEPLWIPVETTDDPNPYRKSPVDQERVIKAPIGDIAPLLVKGYKPGKATLTAILMADDKVETVAGSSVDLDALAKEADKKKAKAAATVKRPTPSCPQCHPGAVEPATEVLLTFLNDYEHEQWAEDRSIIVCGGLSGHRYLIAHRHSARALHQGRICVDLDDRTVLHFHDHTVPPEEEVLAAKLCLEHREPWLRNEATILGSPYTGSVAPYDMLCGRGSAEVYNNPFGDGSDGIPDARFTRNVGHGLLSMAREALEGS